MSLQGRDALDATYNAGRRAGRDFREGVDEGERYIRNDGPRRDLEDALNQIEAGRRQTYKG